MSADLSDDTPCDRLTIYFHLVVVAQGRRAVHLPDIEETGVRVQKLVQVIFYANFRLVTLLWFEDLLIAGGRETLAVRVDIDDIILIEGSDRLEEGRERGIKRSVRMRKIDRAQTIGQRLVSNPVERTVRFVFTLAGGRIG